VLQKLVIQNYAIIDSLEIDFSEGFSTITGETGAGKSIIMGALSLILGQRTDLSFLKNKEKKCVVEAIFSAHNNVFNKLLGDNEIDCNNEIILRREIAANGTSRAFINDTPVNLAQLKSVAIKLIDIHSQHENLLLSDGNYQLYVIDTIAKNNELLSNYKTIFSEYVITNKKINELSEQLENKKKDLDYYEYQLKQFDKINFSESEICELENERDLLQNADNIIENLSTALNFLNTDENSVVVKLKQIKASIENINNLFEPINEIKSRLENIVVEVKDICYELEKAVSKIETNPSKLDVITNKLNNIYELQHKFKVSTVSELIGVKNEILKNINSIVEIENEINQHKGKMLQQTTELEKISQNLNKKRISASATLEKNILPMIKQLGIVNAIFKINIEKTNELNINGSDRVKFMFSANKNIAPDDISKVASGGELSRLMLSIKSLIASNSETETIIFDEIDTGISGEIAYYMGEIMQKMSEKIQVISITHLPQIASRGKHHYLVYKDDKANTSQTKIYKLSNSERVTEIAKMLSGKEVTEAALTNAKNLLNN